MADQITTYFWILCCKKDAQAAAAKGATEGAKALRPSSAAQAFTIGVVHRDIQATHSLDVDAAASLYGDPAMMPPWLRLGRADLYLKFSPPFGTEAEANDWIRKSFDPALHEFAECCFGKVKFSGLS